MMLFGGLFWVGVVALVAVLLWLYAGRMGGGAASGLDLLQQRYARGEIKREEYLRMRADILGRRGGA